MYQLFFKYRISVLDDIQPIKTPGGTPNSEPLIYSILDSDSTKLGKGLILIPIPIPESELSHLWSRESSISGGSIKGRSRRAPPLIENQIPDSES